MDLRNLIAVHLDLARLSRDLDELGHSGRLWAIRQWTLQEMQVLWEASRGFRALTVEDLVPATVQPLVEVIHRGHNSLPAFRDFAKRVFRPTGLDEPDTLFGFNSQWSSPFTGPGYFVVRPSTEPGELVIDYTTTPAQKLESWPDLAPSSARLGRFVWGSCDALRGISSHVNIGRVKKKSSFSNVFFVLVREDAAPPS